MIYLPRKQFPKAVHNQAATLPARSTTSNGYKGKTLANQLWYRHNHARQQRRGAGCAGQLQTASCAVLCSTSLRCSAAHHRLQATSDK